MDLLLQELVGKPKLNPPKIITVIIENFSTLEDEARFLKAILALPVVKQLPLEGISKRLVQLGPLQREVEELAKKSKWSIDHYNLGGADLHDRLAQHLTEDRNRSFLLLNDVSKIELSTHDAQESSKFTALLEDLKFNLGQFIIAIYQGCQPNSCGKMLRNLEQISDAVVRVKTCKSGYFLSMWWETVPTTMTLLPPKVETSYSTCKIGKFFYDPSLLCFYDQKKVTKNYDCNLDIFGEVVNEESSEVDDGGISSSLASYKIVTSDDDERESTMPYTRAQNPNQSRIFYYPDKDDDFDEDDPDSDLGI